MKTFLFLDYDGTLVEFKPKPEQAKPSENLLNLLKKLCRNKNLFVCIVSGRTMKELKKFFPFNGISFVSLHGIEINIHRKKAFVFSGAKKIVPLIKKIAVASEKKFFPVKGILFQDKKYAFVLHYRNVDEKNQKKLKRGFRQLVKKIDARKQLEVIQGAKVLEARVKGWNKGKAVKKILKAMKRKKIDQIFYFGDDFSDEDAFNALKSDFTFLVSAKRKTKANFFIENQKKVVEFLELFS